MDSVCRHACMYFCMLLFFLEIIEIYCEKPEGTESKKFLLDNGRLQLEPIKLSFDLATVELWLGMWVLFLSQCLVCNPCEKLCYHPNICVFPIEQTLLSSQYLCIAYRTNAVVIQIFVYSLQNTCCCHSNIYVFPIEQMLFSSKHVCIPYRTNAIIIQIFVGSLQNK